MADEPGQNPPRIDAEKLKDLGGVYFRRFDQYKKDRRPVEEQWLKNLRQYNGIWDPQIEKKIGPARSKAYPRITRHKVIATVSRMMEALFPQSEKNWTVSASPLPDLPIEDVQKVISQLQAEGTEVTDEAIEAGIKSVAEYKASRMEKVIEDQLAELDYANEIARPVINHGVLYSVGIVKGPFSVPVKSRSWRRNPTNNQIEAIERTTYRPSLEVVSPWSHYPDLSSKTLEGMDGAFDRHIMNRREVRELADRPDFMADRIKEYLAKHPEGNYREESWETEIRSESKDRSNVSDISGRRLELWEWWGIGAQAELDAAGISLPESKKSDVYEVNVWGIGDWIIKVAVLPFRKSVKMHHYFLFETSDLNLLGTGLPSIIRDSQLGVAESARMMMDNASAVCGPILEIDHEMLMPGQDLSIHAYKVFVKEGENGDSRRAVQNVTIDSHISELQTIINLFMGIADMESSLSPAFSGDFGNQTGKEAFRTASGTSQQMTAAGIPLRNPVRNFDRLTTSVLTAIHEWNREFHPDPTIKGDSFILARGSTSLMAKEYLAVSLDQLSVTMPADEKAHLDIRKIVEHKIRARGLPSDILLPIEEVKAREAEAAERQEKQEKIVTENALAEIRKKLASAFKDVATGVKASSAAEAESFNMLMEALTRGFELDNSPDAKSQAK